MEVVDGQIGLFLGSGLVATLGDTEDVAHRRGDVEQAEGGPDRNEDAVVPLQFIATGVRLLDALSWRSQRVDLQFWSAEQHAVAERVLPPGRVWIDGDGVQ